jgi:hypothetical protein
MEGGVMGVGGELVVAAVGVQARGGLRIWGVAEDGWFAAGRPAVVWRPDGTRCLPVVAGVGRVAGPRGSSWLELELAGVGRREVPAGSRVVPWTVAAACLAGAMPPEEVEEMVEDVVDAWHAGRGPGVPLARFLGLNEREYAAWAEGRAGFGTLLAAREEGG